MTPPLLDDSADPGSPHYATPTLMRAARGAYARAMRARLHAIGAADLPRNGAVLLASIDGGGALSGDLAEALGVTKQAVSQLVDILVRRDYIERRADADDRRRVSLRLTDRGRQVLEAVAEGVDTVDAQLLERVSPQQVEAMRLALVALAEIKVESPVPGTGTARPRRQLRAWSPIFAVRDLHAALEHYAMLGFEVVAHDGGDDYGFAERDGLTLHLAADPGHDRARAAAAYLYLRDADALYAQWSRPGIGGRTLPVEPTPYGLREGSHIDPDGNCIRFGSPIEA